MEWKELEIDNLPPDILTGDYEFELKANGVYSSVLKNYRTEIVVLGFLKDGSQYRYRKPEPKQPTLEERIPICKLKKPADCKYRIDGELSFINLCGGNSLYADVSRCDFRCIFIGRESADIPPEK